MGFECNYKNTCWVICEKVMKWQCRLDVYHKWCNWLITHSRPCIVSVAKWRWSFICHLPEVAQRSVTPSDIKRVPLHIKISYPDGDTLTEDERNQKDIEDAFPTVEQMSQINIFTMYTLFIDTPDLCTASCLCNTPWRKAEWDTSRLC